MFCDEVGGVTFLWIRLCGLDVFLRGWACSRCSRLTFDPALYDAGETLLLSPRVLYNSGNGLPSASMMGVKLHPWGTKIWFNLSVL